MPYIAFELDALAGAADVARAAGVAEDAIIAGHARMWAWCWKAKRDTVAPAQLRGFYGGDVAEALVAFGFLELADGIYRVKGAARYLRLAIGQSKGGHAAKKNLVPGSFHRRKSAEGEPKGGAEGGAEQRAEGEPMTEPNTPIGSPSALTSSIEHRASNIKTPAGVAPPPTLAYEPDSLDERLKAAWRQERGSEYDWKQRRDGEAVRELLRLAKDDWAEVERVWRRSLGVDFPRCLGLVTLVQHWPTYAGRDPPKANRGRATEGERDWSQVREEAPF